LVHFDNSARRSNTALIDTHRLELMDALLCQILQLDPIARS
jgi:hypothetical protein